MRREAQPITLLRIVAPRAVGGILFLGPWILVAAPYFAKAMRRDRPKTMAEVQAFAARVGWQTEVVP